MTDDDDIGDDDDMSLSCRKCGHEWVAVVSKPLKCPACNQPKYWLPKVRGNPYQGLARTAAKGAPDGADRVDVYTGSGTLMASAQVKEKHGAKDAHVRGAGSKPKGKTGGSGDDASVPVLPEAEGGAVGLPEVQSVWDKLAARREKP